MMMIRFQLKRTCVLNKLYCTVRVRVLVLLSISKGVATVALHTAFCSSLHGYGIGLFRQLLGPVHCGNFRGASVGGKVYGYP